MIYVRGHKADFDELWARREGCKTWTFQNLLPYFKKSEGCEVPKNEIEEEYHGFNGPLKVSRCTMGRPNPLSLLFVRGCEAVGLGKGETGGLSQKDRMIDGVARRGGYGIDYNGTEQYGASINQVIFFLDFDYRCAT
jgi:choline dehydrogenase-like flavoprotein